MSSGRNGNGAWRHPGVYAGKARIIVMIVALFAPPRMSPHPVPDPRPIRIQPDFRSLAVSGSCCQGMSTPLGASRP